MITKLMKWRWGPGGKLGISEAAGLSLVSLIVLAIAADLAGLTRQVAPPPWIGADSRVDASQVCQDFPGGVELVRAVDAEWSDRGWPSWPAPVPRDCDAAHVAAPTGVVRWHSCDAMRQVGDLFVAPCQGPGGPQDGASWVRTEGGRVVSADLYVRRGAPSCTAIHEGGHARGFVVTPEEDAATPHVRGAHTERPNHIMAEDCGHRWTWLDRTEGGDWIAR